MNLWHTRHEPMSSSEENSYAAAQNVFHLEEKYLENQRKSAASWVDDWLDFLRARYNFKDRFGYYPKRKEQ